MVEPGARDLGSGTVTEEESQLETCRKMAGWGEDQSTPASMSGRTEEREILEYHDGVNPTTILGELFAQSKPRRFVRVAVRDVFPMQQDQTEDIMTANMEFLRKRGAFNLPSQSVW